ncbi:MAG: RagB/SusD family nutrient uptake outer membrane protein [Chitinophagaceae bacterium]|nr:RagB/SusD family nutrient uptake outer membrane protein [Chitinophagaceae bacterium]
MTSYFKILIFPALLLLACNKFLDVKPKTSTSDDQTITDASSANTAVRGIYNALESNDYYGYTFQTLGFFSGDNIQYVGSQTVNQQLTNHAVLSDLAALNTSWLAIYNTINRANNVLAKLPAIPSGAGFADSVKNQLLGEAYFLRALAYFDLARTWGGVQLILKPTSSASDKPSVKRSSLADTYAQVLNDLKAAEPLLPLTTNRIRATRKTVWALLARYYLYQKDWVNAETYATKLITDNNYTLLKPYNSFFANNAANTKESVFELYYNTTVTNNQASQWQPTSNGGVGWIKPTDAAVSLLNDPTIGGGRNTLVQKVVSSGVTNWYGNLYYRTVGTDPAYLIRIAELYLIRAEARAQKEDFIGSNDDLNAIRSRAGIDSANIQDKNALLLTIENENRVEFALENHRWYDLVRTNRAGTVLGITDERKFLLPIPYAQVAVDLNLAQNPGYSNN